MFPFSPLRRWRLDVQFNVGCPHYPAHKAEHDRFLDEVTGAVAAFGEEFDHENVDKLAHRVQEWIVSHITTFDRQLVERGR